MHKNVVIAGYARSPFHFAHKGALTKVRPDELTAEVIAALIAKSGVEASDIEDVIVGCAFPEGEQGMNMARLIGLLAHLPISVAGTTVNRFCGSSMQAIHMAAGAIQLDAGDVFVCAGVESMTRVPIGGYNPVAEPEARRRVSPGLRQHGRDRRERRQAVPDHARRPAGVRGPEPPQGRGRARTGQARGRDRADPDQRPDGRCRRLHPAGDQPGGAGRPEARVR